MAKPEYRVVAPEYAAPLEAVPLNLEFGRISWGGIWGGFLFIIGTLLLLSTLGLAIGISVADIGTGQALDPSGLGIGAAIWSGLSLLIAVFIGGMIATRVGMVLDRTAGAIQGFLVWVLGMLGIIYLASSGIGLVASGAFNLLGGITGPVGAVVQGAPQLNNLLSGDVNQIIDRLDDPQTTSTIAAATGMPQEEVRSRLVEIRTRVEAAVDNPAEAVAQARQGLQQLLAQAGQQAERAAAAAQPYASGALWTTFAVLVLSLLAAILGAMLGTRQAAARVGVADSSS